MIVNAIGKSALTYYAVARVSSFDHDPLEECFDRLSEDITVVVVHVDCSAS